MAFCTTAPRPISWVLALVMAVALGEVVVRSALWPVTTFEDTREISMVVFGQTYRAARKIYASGCAGRRAIVLLGDSRMQFAAREAPLRAALLEIDPSRDYCVRNLAIFGAAIGDLDVIERHVERMDPALVVLAIDEANLQTTALGGLRNVPAALLSTGWSDGPIPATGFPERVDRWVRTAWPLYRFREFIRAAITDRFRPDVSSHPWPPRFRSRAEFFRYAHGQRAEPVIAAYRKWQHRGDLDTFVEFLEVERSSYVDWVRSRSETPLANPDRSLARLVLEDLLDRMNLHSVRSMVLIPPRNPLLASDSTGEFFDPDRADETITTIQTASTDRRVPVVDARWWMPAEAFFDFDHLIPDVPQFETLLAAKIRDVLSTN